MEHSNRQSGSHQFSASLSSWQGLHRAFATGKYEIFSIFLVKQYGTVFLADA